MEDVLFLCLFGKRSSWLLLTRLWMIECVDDLECSVDVCNPAPKMTSISMYVVQLPRSPEAMSCHQSYKHPGLILHGGNEGDCLHAPWSLPWCTWYAPVQVYNFLMAWCPCPFKNEANTYRRLLVENKQAWTTTIKHALTMECLLKASRTIARLQQTWSASSRNTTAKQNCSLNVIT